jgi:hypothetical protein
MNELCLITVRTGYFISCIVFLEQLIVIQLAKKLPFVMEPYPEVVQSVHAFITNPTYIFGVVRMRSYKNPPVSITMSVCSSVCT